MPIHSNLWLSSWTKATLSFDKFSGTFDVVFSGFVFNYVRISICKDDFKCNNFSYKCAGRNNTKICSRVKRWTFALITITWATLTFSEIEGCCAKYFCEGALRCPDHFLIFRGYSHHSTADRLKRIFFKCCGRDTPYLSTKWAWVLSNGMNTLETIFETKRKKVPNVV